MGYSIMARSLGFVVVCLLLSLWACSSIVSSDELVFVVGETGALQVTPSIEVTGSPGLKPGKAVLCERIYIRGLKRFKHMEKYAHSLKLRVAHNASTGGRTSVDVCFHRNSSRAVGMCPQGQWDKVSKGSWVQIMSPFDHKILDIRVSGSSNVTLHLSAEEEFFMYRVIFLILGIVLLASASTLSRSLSFYYSSAMAVGIILVVLVVLFQGMKLLPTGRKSSLALFLYSSLVGVGGFLLRYIPGLIQSLLMEMGINEDMYTPLAVFLGAFLSLSGAWLGFWIVRKLVLTEDGSIDISTSLFVSWSIRILAAVMILQSSIDPILAGGALISGIFVSSLLKTVTRLKFLRRLFKKLLKLLKQMWEGIRNADVPPIRESLLDGTEYLQSGSHHVRFATPPRGTGRMMERSPSDSDSFPSSFHKTPEQRKLKKEEWEKFTRESTEKAVKELVSSPAFGQWAATNADRISVTPRTGSSSGAAASVRRRRWLPWFSSNQ
ncbi:PREDICTED: uncharacterized protein LOC104821209 isoform X2 [Tarenaya hassleriana]|uniref:uncharacterized protein LOC104821209 isoform X2 n=1 Tax=Tarenaya hassleriana TaxID=28532 RepID=UPI00053C1DAF|nr:PREDICTED: uncharacterized protein LOC104821209 isoform X2 [Tarenaya hassleriana]